MALDDHSVVAIAQTVAYVPIVPLSIYVLVRNYSYRPRKAWYPFVIFSSMRLAGGPVVIVLESRGGPDNPDNLSLVVAAIALLSIGWIPMIVATLGQVQLILKAKQQSTRLLDLIPRIARLVGLIAAMGLITAAPLQSQPDTANVGRILTQVSNIVFALVLTGLIMVEILLWREFTTLNGFGKMALKHATFAIPFLAVRTIYSLIEVFTSAETTSIWNPLYGNAVLFATMALLMEYITMGFYIWVGLRLRSHIESSGTADPSKKHNTNNTAAA